MALRRALAVEQVRDADVLAEVRPVNPFTSPDQFPPSVSLERLWGSALGSGPTPGEQLMFKKRSSRKAVEAEAAVLRCSFCNKDQRDVRKLIAGPHVYICDECVKVCVDIIAEDQPGGALKISLSESVACALCHTLTPAEDLLWIRERGPLCSGCVSEVEATAAELRESRPEGG